MNIIDYVKKVNETFAEKSFNNVDSLILSQLFYSRFEDMLRLIGVDSVHPGFVIRDFYLREYFPLLFSDGITDENNEILLTVAAASPRYRNIPIKYIQADLDADSEKQFAAATFEIDDATEFVCFRGTDGSLLGWKEDFNLSFMDKIPSHSDAVEYINRHFGEGGESAGKRFYVAGHSKGGNLAMYGALMSDPSIHERIIKVYSFEGPGFREDVTDRLRAIAERDGILLDKLVPQGSLIGMIMETASDVKVVESDAIGVRQHAAFSWQLEGDDFSYRDRLSYSGAWNNRVLRRWLENEEDEVRRDFVDTMFCIFEDNNIDSINMMKGLNPARTAGFIESYSKLPPDTKKMLLDVFGELAKASVASVPPESVTAQIGSIAGQALKTIGGLKEDFQSWSGEQVEKTSNMLMKIRRGSNDEG